MSCVHSTPGGLDAKAVEAVRRWRSRPGRIDGAPVDVFVTVMVNFHLFWLIKPASASLKVHTTVARTTAPSNRRTG